ncbi:MAG: Do family serine endopeptidase [Bacteroidetes bacterium]|nr:Do family serine endopeptidase [Bacteroidota bacterium]
MTNRKRLSMATVVIGAFLGGILLATSGANFLNLSELVGTDANASTTMILPSTQPPGNTVTPPPGVQGLEDSFTAVADLVGPTVVQIRSEKVQTVDRSQNPFQGTPFEEWFGGDRGNQFPQEYRTNALGSGVIISNDGYIVTNNHVVDDSESLEVKLFDGEFYDAKVVGRDVSSDLAVIKIEANGLNNIAYGDPQAVKVGQWVLAFGSPLSEDLDNTVTAGIVSAMHRSGSSLRQVNALPAFIQTDAAINPGNSGGPLVNIRGELIGINSAILSRSGGSQGIGFAIPIDIVQNVVGQLIEHGEVKRGYLGILFGPVSPALAKAYDVSRSTAQVSSVEPGLPADKAGLKAGDLIVKVDDRPLNDYNELAVSIANRLPGDKVKLEIVRDGKEMTVPVTLGLRPGEEELAGRSRGESMDSGSEQTMSGLGIKLADLDDATVRALGVSRAELPSGVLVADIDPSSDAFRDAELRKGDIITELDKKAVQTRAEFEKVYRKIDSGDTFIIRVHRFVNGVDQTFITALVKP